MTETMEEKNERNARVQARYDELMRIGRHGHYETMFQVVREETDRLRKRVEELEGYLKSSVNYVKASAAEYSDFRDLKLAQEIDAALNKDKPE